jgi:hypothetical protein
LGASHQERVAGQTGLESLVRNSAVLKIQVAEASRVAAGCKLVEYNVACEGLMREQASRNGYRTIVLIVLLGLSAGLDFGQAAQSNATANGAQATPTFRSSSRLVLVDVVVTDKAGQTVKGLKAADFTILEDGKTQPIRAFESHVWQKTPASMQKINLPPDQYTNFTEQQPNSAVNVVLLDILNTPQHDQQYARKQMIAFLRELPPRQRIALFVLGTKLTMIQGFTGSSDLLVEAAQSILSNTSPLLTTESEYQDAVSDITYFADAASAGGDRRCC